jgi:hypothetical protein
MSEFGTVRKVIPSDTAVLEPFKYIQCGVSGNIAIESDTAAITVVSSNLLDRISIVPTGISVKVRATDTTATDIYVWG